LDCDILDHRGESGDVLAKQGHSKETLAMYDKALKYAPNWGSSSKRVRRQRSKKPDYDSERLPAPAKTSAKM
jgi:hypothetical protein